jgi:thiazole tautomerase (transcriptional regulator TenI)
MVDVPVVHAVTTDKIILARDFIARAISVMQALGERGAIHLRSQLIPSQRLYDIACRLTSLHADTGCWCIVSDRLDIAMASFAHGVQLNSRSMTASDARKVAPKLRIGASVHSTAEAETAESEGADWCVAGNVFETPSHPGAPRRESTFISEIVARVDIPIIAIGGIHPEHVRSLIEGGAYGIASIRGIWEAKNSEQAATRYLSEYDGHHTASGSHGVANGGGR